MRSLTITLPDDIVEDIEARVAAGDYASESDLVRIALEAFPAPAQDPAVETWLRDVVVPRCRERAAHPTPLVPAEEIVDRIQRRFAAKHR